MESYGLRRRGDGHCLRHWPSYDRKAMGFDSVVGHNYGFYGIEWGNCQVSGSLFDEFPGE